MNNKIISILFAITTMILISILVFAENGGGGGGICTAGSTCSISSIKLSPSEITIGEPLNVKVVVTNSADEDRDIGVFVDIFTTDGDPLCEYSETRPCEGFVYYVGTERKVVPANSEKTYRIQSTIPEDIEPGEYLLLVYEQLYPDDCMLDYEILKITLN